MNRVQLFILAQLGESESLRFSELKPKSMEPAQFMYHMNRLIESGLVHKQDNRYLLSDQGIQFIDRFSLDQLEPISYPRLGLSLVYRSKDKGYLLSKINRQPLLGQIGLIIFDVPLELKTSIVDFATDCFQQLTGRSVVFTHFADGYIKLLNNNKITANMLTHVMSSDGPSFKIAANEASLIWQSELPIDQPLYSSTAFVLDKITTGDRSFFELNVED
jgi:hypothetical protein